MGDNTIVNELEDYDEQVGDGIVEVNADKRRRHWGQRRAQKKRRRTMRKTRKHLAHGKRWCCRQGKMENKKGGNKNLCIADTPAQIIDFANFKFGIGRDVCENSFKRCCSNGKLRRKIIKQKMKKVQKKKWKKILNNRKKGKTHKNKRTGDV